MLVAASLPSAHLARNLSFAPSAEAAEVLGVPFESNSDESLRSKYGCCMGQNASALRNRHMQSKKKLANEELKAPRSTTLQLLHTQQAPHTTTQHKFFFIGSSHILLNCW
jgi:hypothetical protein